ncbi:MAG TPA: PQQ-binding-like beta-propeller repeat protein [Acidobacteriaceae bacterium]|nr:PQQ-binding-like beta-propeller repeat protein [Acidobacteriaceae bacterium]
MSKHTMHLTSTLRRLSAPLAALAVMLPFTVAAAHAQSTANPVAQEFPSQYLPHNLPSPHLASYFPQQWKTYASSAGRNAVFPLPASAPASLRSGVSWSFAGAGAVPLNGPPLIGDFKTTAYTVGMPVGVSVVRGILYAGDDNGYTYALNAITGKLIWSHYGWNMNMSNPLVDGDRVIVSTGNAYFNYAKTMQYVRGKRTVRGPGLNSIYALDRTTGREIWAFHTPGEIMPTPVDLDGFLYVGTGDGHVYKVSVATGKLAWKTNIVSFVSMSSPVAGDGNIFVGGTYPNYFYALDQKTGKIAWKTTIPGLVATGISDCTPAYANGIVVQEATIESGDPANPVANVLLALDAKTGKLLWQQRMSNGPVPPAMKTATPMITHGVVYEGSPVTGNYHAFDLRTGKKLWTVHLGSQIRAGAAVLDGVAYIPYHSGDIAAIRIADGKLLGKKHIGGSFGPSSPVIVGGTLYVSNVFGWVTAIPIRQITASSAR